MKILLTVLIVIFIIVAVIGVVAAIIVSSLKKKAREISARAFGTTDLMEGFKQMQEDYEDTPKSVSAMTSVMLPRITADFPDFNYDEMKKRAETVLTGYLRGITESSADSLLYAGDELKQKLKTYIDMLSDKGFSEKFDLIKIHRTEIKRYARTNGKCIVTFQSALESRHYTLDSAGSVTKGSPDRKEQSRYDVDMIYVQDRNLVDNEKEDALGITCPNCGAPVKILGRKYCEYCGAGIVELNINAWTFSDVKAVS